MKFSSVSPRLQISLGPETANRKDQKGKSQMHTTAQEHTLRSLQAPSGQNHGITDGAQGSLAAVAGGRVKSPCSRLCLAMYLIAASCMGWRGGCWTWNCLLDGLTGLTGAQWQWMHCLLLAVIRVHRDSAAKHLSEIAACTMPQRLLVDDTLHIEAKQISFSTTETFAYMGI